MIKITFESSGSISNVIEDAIRAAFLQGLQEKLENYRCPEHGKPVESVSLSGGKLTDNSFDDVQMRVVACCHLATEEACRILGVGEA